MDQKRVGENFGSDLEHIPDTSVSRKVGLLGDERPLAAQKIGYSGDRCDNNNLRHIQQQLPVPF